VGAVSVDVVVTGAVQGVFFRATMRDEARDLDVSGWVRNEPDGSVAAHLEGSADSVSALVEWCRHGPSGAEVDQVVTTEAPANGLSGFAVRQA
jgi:acylphosphatase